MRFVDLFAGLGGFHLALKSLGHDCVFASELDAELREIYSINFPEMRKRVFGDIREFKAKVPAHDILCAGFPCQPFSKSGAQKGTKDKTRGTLFHEILEILDIHRPTFVVLENVGNFERHDGGRTWRIVKDSLEALEYHVRGTEHLTSGGHGLISPHHLGYPHTRERFFIVASQFEIKNDPFPKRNQDSDTSLSDITQLKSELTREDVAETALTRSYVDCIEHWNRFIQQIPLKVEIPSFPLWGDEIDAKYPYKETTPFASSTRTLKEVVRINGHEATSKEQLINLLPSYARTQEDKFPDWKVKFIDQNRIWFKDHRNYLKAKWISDLQQFPPSLRKFEWNCKGEERDLWKYVLQFRPSGLRAKRYSSSPALVAMTTSQIPILGPKGRFISRVEGLRLQGFPDTHCLPRTRQAAFKALGNAVHVAVAKKVAGGLIKSR